MYFITFITDPICLILLLRLKQLLFGLALFDDLAYKVV